MPIETKVLIDLATTLGWATGVLIGLGAMGLVLMAIAVDNLRAIKKEMRRGTNGR